MLRTHRIARARAFIAHSAYGRMMSGVAANAVGKLWVILLQLFSVPVFVSCWGANDYGLWLMLSTVPVYMALSDFGFGTAAAADMTRLITLRRQQDALATFQSIWVLLSGTMCLVLVIALTLWAVRSWIWAAAGEPQFELIADAALVFCIYSVVAVQMNVLGVVYRSTNRYTQGTLLGEIVYPLEGVATIVVATTGGYLLQAAIAMLVVRISAFTLYYLRIKRLEPWLELGWRYASRREVSRLARPALAAFSLNVSSAISLQGTVLVLGWFVSPTATAIFGAGRTLARGPLQFIALFSRAALPELSAAHARNDETVLVRLVVINLAITLFFSVLSALVLAFCGHYFLSLLSHRQLDAPRYMFVIFGLTIIFQPLWATLAQFLFAVNKQEKFAFFYIALAALIAAAPLLGAKTTAIDRTAAVACLSEALMLIVVYRVWRREHPIDFASIAAAARWSVAHTKQGAIRVLFSGVGETKQPVDPGSLDSREMPDHSVNPPQ